MKILNEYPPNIEKIKRFLNLQGNEHFVYGEDIYNPTGAVIDNAILEHEKIHIRQQREYGAEAWWDRYLLDPAFRLSQEVEAYQVHYKIASKLIRDKNRKARFLDTLATELSSETYGKMISYSEAMRAIQEKEPIRFRV